MFQWLIIKSDMVCTIRYYQELNFFIKPSNRGKDIIIPIYPQQSIKDLIESMGVPHTEVDLILINGISVDFSYIVKNEDRVSVYPVFESFNIEQVTKLRPEPLRCLNFILDVHLGKLTKDLRMLGFDSLYRNDYRDSEIAEISHNEGRIVLTRDRGLLKRSIITRGYYLKSDNPKVQIKEVVNRFDLIPLCKPLTRCIRCNGILKHITKEEVLGELEPKTKKYFHEFYRCKSCMKIYWRGSHYEHMLKSMHEWGLSI